MMQYFIVFVLLFSIVPESFAKSDICELLKLDPCPSGGSSIRKSSQASHPSQSSGVSFNPSSIPTDKGLGLEILNYAWEQDFAIVTGTGRIGAAISPSSYEDSFFGNMSYESSSVYLQRKLDGKKFKSNKVSLGTSMKLFDNKKKKMKSFRGNLGVIGKYNQDSKNYNFGAGISLEISLLSLGVTRYKDDYFIKGDPLPLAPDQLQRYEVDTFSFGIKLPHIVADYTYLVNKFDYNGYQYEDKITLTTATLFYKKFMFTYGHRKEESYRPRVNFETKSLDYIEDKYDAFLGVQYSLNRHFILGAYYNYYLNYGYTIGLTGFL